MTKSKLRKIYLARQLALGERERREKSLAITRRFFEEFSLTDVRVLHLFLSIKEKGEIDTAPIFEKLWRDFPHIKTVVPRVDFKRDVLEHLEYNSATELRTNHWGIKEPAGTQLVDEKEIDLVLVPLLAYDERGYRVGHGKGFYDKFLSLCRADVQTIGLSFFPPVKQIKDIQDFDIPLNFFIEH